MQGRAQGSTLQRYHLLRRIFILTNYSKFSNYHAFESVSLTVVIRVI